MKTLILTRHAKSDWDDPGLDDHDRPLSKRGRKAAPRMGSWVAARAIPAEALVSTAARAVETYLRMAPSFATAPALRLLPQLYHAEPETMLEALQGTTADTVLMIGHNPTIANFAEAVLATPPDDLDFRHFPTAATLIATFDIGAWGDLRVGTGTAEAFAVPRHL